MTPFELDILLHYYSRADDHPVMFDNPPIWPQTRDHFKAEELLGERPADKRHGDALYYLTERGKAYIEAVLALPLPVQVWVMPIAPPARTAEPK